jgi:GNAT superfamily N-acetyltransferase
MTDWFVSIDPQLVQLDVVHGWLRTSYWSPNVRRDILEQAFAHSIVVGAYRGATQVGFARAVTDFATFAWLCDVFVDESARREGIATAMVRTLIEDPRLQTLRRWCLGTKHAHAVYRPFGFAPVDATIWMQVLRDPATWSEPPG